jgi:subtilisin family serine protease
MKQLYFLIFLIVFQVASAQKQDPRTDRFNYDQQEIIVKLKDDVSTGVTYRKQGKGMTSKNIGELLGIAEKVENSSVLFSQKSVEASLKRKQQQTSKLAARSREEKEKNGYEEPDVISLKNIFLLKLKNKQENIEELISSLAKNPDVEFAEPNYRYSVNDFTINSEILTEEDLKKERKNEKMAAFVAPNDALYAQQSNIAAVNLDKVWDSGTTGDSSQIIAILDTGVDYTHPDLEANSWTNQAELEGVAGYDDDGNGYIDDIHGWDFINLDGEPLDDNMHGTHVAGIAGAVGNNELGIAGAAWNVKLMAVKVFQSNGVGNATTIAQGIEYAANNGATVINMSFGTYAESMTMKAALENAYATSVLVASAGNSGLCIGPGKCPDGRYSSPLYPGAYTYVLGVKDAAGYSNYDQDGPIYSGYSNLLNYELKAPGSGILSAVPGGGYRKLTGTSMSAPLVAGGIALYLQNKPEDSKELLFGNLINTAGSYVDFKAAIEVVPTPKLNVLSAITKDTLTGQNGNGYLEPGETIDIIPLVKNYWGPTEDVRVGIEFAEFEDPTKATILKSEIEIGSITAYAELQDLTKSLQIKLAEGLANNVNIKFNLKVWSGPNQNYLTTSEYIVNVKNSILLSGIITEDLTLYPDREYLVSGNLVIGQDATLTIMPGVKLYFSDNTALKIDGFLIANGNKTERIYFLPESNFWNGIQILNDVEFRYCKFSGVWGANTPSIKNAKGLNIENCEFSNNYGPLVGKLGVNTSIIKSVIYENELNYWAPSSSGINPTGFLNSNFISNKKELSVGNLASNVSNTIFFNNNGISLKASYGQNTTIDMPIYLGTSSEKLLDKYIFDFFDDSNYGLLYINNLSPIPFEANHGIVWKVLINGQDAQDEYELIDPIGVGTHEFQVYFNRPMDTLAAPQVSYGVREPYTQKIISEQGTWSADGKIYTVNHEVKIGAADGINRIRVQNARDLDYFEIPVEDFRFNMLVQSAGSASSGFFATADLGKISLDWEEPSSELLEDVLGYNMYRYEALTDSTFTEPVKINENLINDITFTDFNVEEGETYYYQYKILRTNFEESDFSKTVSTSPLTSVLGDSNGDFSVNVLDLVQDVDHILGNNPQPFIFKAADVNADGSINVLDIVGTVDIINSPATSSYVASSTNPDLPFYSNVPVGEATFYWDGDDLFVESKHSIGGLQLAFEEGFQYTLNSSLSNFEWSNYGQEESRILMMYSFSGLSIAPGKTKLLTRLSSDSSLDIERAVTGTPDGLKLTPLYMDFELEEIEAPAQKDRLKIVKFYPNPTAGEINLKYYLPQNMDLLNVTIYSMQGEVLFTDNTLKNTKGIGEKQFNFDDLRPGIYFFVLDAVRNGEIKQREVRKIIKV